MMLGARTAAWAKTGVPLSYDSKILFLKSTGTQYVDIEYVPKINTKFTMDFRYWTTNAPDGLAMQNGSRSDSSNQMILECQYGRIDVCCGDSVLNTSQNTNRHTAIIDFQNLIAQLDNNIYRGTSQISPEPVNSIFIFARNIGSGPQHYSRIEVYSITLEEDGVVVGKIIPVRIGDVGFLYDEIRDKMFSNRGTGSFILGPDVNT